MTRTTKVISNFRMELFRMPKFALKLLGFWPETELNPIRLAHGIFSVIIVSWGVLSEFVYGVTHLDNPIIALDAIAPPLTKGVSILKLVTMWTSRKKLRDLIKRTDALLKAEGSEEKVKILTNMKRTIELFGASVLILGNTTNLAFFLRPIGNNVLNYMHGRNLTREMPFVAWTPFDTSSKIVYICAYMLNSSFGFVAACALGAVDGMFVQFFLYISTLFQICQEDIREAFHKRTKAVITKAHIKVTRQRLSAFVQKHNSIMHLSAEIVDLYTIIVLCHFLSSAIIICISCVDFILVTIIEFHYVNNKKVILELQGSGFTIVVYAINSALVVAELFIYCNGGSKVVESVKKFYD